MSEKQLIWMITTWNIGFVTIQTWHDDMKNKWSNDEWNMEMIRLILTNLMLDAKSGSPTIQTIPIVD